jgi:hypothetical protein
MLVESHKYFCLNECRVFVLDQSFGGRQHRKWHLGASRSTNFAPKPCSIHSDYLYGIQNPDSGKYPGPKEEFLVPDSALSCNMDMQSMYRSWPSQKTQRACGGHLNIQSSDEISALAGDRNLLS